MNNLIDYSKLKDYLPFPINLNSTKVKITIRSTGQSSILPWNEVSKRAIEKGDSDLCAYLYKHKKKIKFMKLNDKYDKILFEVI